MNVTHKFTLIDKRSDIIKDLAKLKLKLSKLKLRFI